MKIVENEYNIRLVFGVSSLCFGGVPVIGSVALKELTKRKVLKARHLFHSKLYDDTGNSFDSAMAVFLPGPSTFTGEDSAEVYTHGSRAVVNVMNSRLAGMQGLRHATAGEFTKRALVNGKLSSSEVLALGALLNAQSDRQLRQANRALAHGDWLADSLTRLRSQLAIAMDFGEDVESDVQEIRKEIRRLKEGVKRRRLLDQGARRVREGLNLVLLGTPNVGKSSLLNRLCGRNRAIVSPVPGTTRDIVQVEREMNGVRIRIEDTAGVHSTEDLVEEEGIRRTKESLQRADIVLLVEDAREEENKELRSIIPDGIEVIRVRNKADLIQIPDDNDRNTVMTIATQESGIDELEKRLSQLVTQLCPEDAEITLSAGLPEVEKLLEEAGNHSDIAVASELVKMAAEAWGRECSSEHVLSLVMKDFCIGK